MPENLLKTMTLEELRQEKEKQVDHPKRCALIEQEIKTRQEKENALRR
jgi:hypothetical protein